MVVSNNYFKNFFGFGLLVCVENIFCICLEIICYIFEWEFLFDVLICMR